MKKKLCTILLAVSMMAMAFTGCASEETSDVANMIESLEARHESGPGVYVPEEEEDTSVDLKNKLGIGTNEEQVDKDNSGTATGQESVAASEGADNGQSGEGVDTGDASGEVANTDTSANEDGTDWSESYDGYFQRGNTLPEMPKVTMSATGDGISMTVVTAVSEDVVRMAFDCGVAEMDIYMDNEKMYAYTTLEGKSEWTYTRIASEEEAESMLSMGEMARISDEWNGIKRHTYRSEVVVDGITYDTLNVVVEDEAGTYPCVFYVNRETQMVDRYTCVKEGMNMDCRVTEAEPFSLPDGASKAKEVEMEDIATNMVAVIIAGAQG